MTTQQQTQTPTGADEVADAYVAAFRGGDLARAGELMAPDMVRVSPLEGTGDAGEIRGLDAIMANAARLTAEYDIRGVDVQGPFVSGDRFAVRFAFDQVHVPTGHRADTVKMCLYTVVGGRIAREEVFYHNEPQQAG
ncbi:nuclear transport factor 2 family protein [Nocardiopsis sediminis]|uniref:Nuclear transport factor 2 family protein n=1 Tax=Nocardiopsis sediminis TaxID=1778267 RepID=A0ABV8FVS0_9ACTN